MIVKRLINWVSGWGGPLGFSSGEQIAVPVEPLFSDLKEIEESKALQISTIFACTELLANTMSTFPIFIYKGSKDKGRTPDRNSNIFTLLHDKPNDWMTPSEFVSAMVINRMLRGNAYALIQRGADDEPVALIPLPAEQVEMTVIGNRETYIYYLDGQVNVYSGDNIIHWKGVGNGYKGLSKIRFMSATANEAVNAQSNATKFFGERSKPTGVLCTDQKLGDSQFKEVLKRFSGMAKGDGSGLFLVDRGFNYSSMSLSPQDAQLLETRKYNVEEICRWFGVPPVLIGASGVTTWGSGIAEIVSGFHKFTLAPLCTQFQQALTRKLNHVWDRDKYTIEMKLDALLRSNPQERAAYYSQMAQNGMMTRNEVRGLENLPPAEGGDELTAQSNLVPLKKLGQVETTSNPPDGSPVRQ